jgi:hypothetical protein
VATLVVAQLLFLEAPGELMSMLISSLGLDRQAARRRSCCEGMTPDRSRRSDKEANLLVNEVGIGPGQFRRQPFRYGKTVVNFNAK